MTDVSPQPTVRARVALSAAELAEVQELAERARAQGVEPRLVWQALTNPERETVSHFLADRAGVLLGFLTVDGLDSGEPEGALLTDPAEPAGPIERALTEVAQVVAHQHGGGPLMIALDRRAAAAAAALQGLGFVRHMTECLMLRESALAPELPASELRVAPALGDDAPAIAAILANDLGIDPAELVLPVSANMRRSGYSYYLARLGDEPAGTLNVQVLNDLPFIYGFVVPAEYRGRGFGRQLLTHALTDLLRDGPQPIYLEVDPENTRALRLYESLGFQITTTFDYYREPGSPGG